MNHLSIVALAFVCACLGAQFCGAQEQLPQQNQIRSDSLNANSNQVRNFIEIDKLIVDETISKAGLDFLELFLASWTWPQNTNGSFQMVVTEKPFRGISTQVVITLNDLIVFESFLQTRFDVLESLAQQAVEQTSAYLMNYESIMRQLEGDDTAGNGIY